MRLGYIDIHAAIISFLIKYNLWSEKDKKTNHLKEPLNTKPVLPHHFYEFLKQSKFLSQEQVLFEIIKIQENSPPNCVVCLIHENHPTYS